MHVLLLTSAAQGSCDAHNSDQSSQTPEWAAYDAAQEAIALLRRRVHDFNACVPCGGVSPGARPDEALLPALFALLPTPLAVGISVAPPDSQVMPSCCCTQTRPGQML